MGDYASVISSLAHGERIRRASWAKDAWVKSMPARLVAERVRVAGLTVAQYNAERGKTAIAGEGVGGARDALPVAVAIPRLNPANQRPVLIMQDGSEWQWSKDDFVATDWDLVDAGAMPLGLMSEPAKPSRLAALFGWFTGKRDNQNG